MNKKLWSALAAILTTGMLATGAKAANPAEVNISVTITSALSVSVDGIASSTRTHTWSGTPNQMFDNTASSIAVLNDSGILTEKWALSTNANSIPASGTGWTLGASTNSVGADTFGLQAVFGSSNTAIGGCASVTATTWNDATIAPPLTASAVTYTSTVFGSTELTNAGGSPTPDVGTGEMYAGNKRALCYRTIMPASTSKTAIQNVQVIVTAQ
ncbi:MAG: hypothetical protein COV48_10530 [Elusimicrobia bacterium CG11_big_fil_rev_8_21_14_0_20_64_6]|nr:MAG: hypothetical protein COV48_10530 [Elusimicrobia bacterium CG11_big_fil_rev_8_21_14_0_20_64_6]